MRRDTTGSTFQGGQRRHGRFGAPEEEKGGRGYRGERSAES